MDTFDSTEETGLWFGASRYLRVIVSGAARSSDLGKGNGILALALAFRVQRAFAGRCILVRQQGQISEVLFVETGCHPCDFCGG